MNLCSDKHEEVCYEGSACPICEVADELKIANTRIEELLQEVKTLEETE